MFEINSCDCDELNAKENHFLLIQEIINRGNINIIFHNCKIDEVSKRDKYYLLFCALSCIIFYTTFERLL